AHLRRQPFGLVQRPDGVLSGRRPPGAGAGHRLDRAPAAPGRPDRVFDARGRVDGDRPDQRPVRAPREIGRRDRARALCRGPGPGPAAGHGVGMSAVESLRIAHIAPVATTIPPPKSGSVEFMTSLLTEGLVAAGHDVTLFATANSTTTAKLH